MKQIKKEDSFFLISLLTVLAIRANVFLFPEGRIVLQGIHINHFWIGIGLILFMLFLMPKSFSGLRTFLFFVGMGIAADELIFMILGGGTISDYWSVYSLFGAVLTLVIIFVLRKRLSALVYIP